MEALWSTTTQDSTVSYETTVCVRLSFFLKGAREDFRVRLHVFVRKRGGGELEGLGRIEVLRVLLLPSSRIR